MRKAKERDFWAVDTVIGGGDSEDLNACTHLTMDGWGFGLVCTVKETLKPFDDHKN